MDVKKPKVLLIVPPRTILESSVKRCCTPIGLAYIAAVLEKEVNGQKDWTQFEMGLFKRTHDSIIFSPQKLPSRLQSLSNAEGIICIPEGIETIPAGSQVDVQVIAQLAQVFNA